MNRAMGAVAIQMVLLTTLVADLLIIVGLVQHQLLMLRKNGIQTRGRHTPHVLRRLGTTMTQADETLQDSPNK